MDNLPATRALLQSAIERIDAVEKSAAERFEQYEEAMEVQRKSTNRWRLLFAGILVLLLAAGLFVASTVRDNVEATNRNAAALARSNEVRAEEARDICERGNKSTEVDRFIINRKFDDFLLGPNVQTAEQQQRIQNRRANELKMLDELRPLRDCDEAAEEAVPD